ncbi:MAG: hypothetical protein IKA87_00770 [Lentisphaeria bacterium]|nr:hypothetical protein [Lentisphaeria bacterium]
MKTLFAAAVVLSMGLLSGEDYLKIFREASQAEKQKQFAVAEAKYGEALKISANSGQKSRAVLGKFRAMRGLKKFKEAEKLALESVEDESISFQDARHILNTVAGTLLWSARQHEALALLQQAQNVQCLKSSNIYFSTFYLMAVIYMQRKQYQAAIEVLGNVAAVREQHPANLYTANLMTGNALERLGKKSEALKYFRTALENGKKVRYKFNFSQAEKAIERLSK